MYYENKGDKQVTEEIIYTVKNIEITEKKVMLLPKQSKFIMHPVLAGEYQCSMKSNTLYKWYQYLNDELIFFNNLILILYIFRLAN